MRVYEQRLLELSAATRSAGLLVTILPEPLLLYALASRDFYRSLDPGLLRKVSALWIARDRRCMESIVELHTAHGLGSRFLDETPESLSLERGELVAEIEEYIVDAGRVLPTLLSEAERLGVKIVEERVEGSPGRYRAPSGRLRGTVIVAAGPWTPRLVPELRGELLVYRCQAASVEGARPPAPVEDDSLGYYIVPVSPSRSNIGDGSNARLADPMEGYVPDPEDTYEVLEKYAGRNPEAWNARVLQVWSAPCATTRRGIPLVRQLGGDTIVYTGFNGAGLTLAPGMTEALLRLLEGQDPGLPEIVLGPEPVPEPYNVCS